ncbi:MAG: extracellular solute-binding protein [Chloroflexota bacterium]
MKGSGFTSVITRRDLLKAGAALIGGAAVAACSPAAPASTPTTKSAAPPAAPNSSPAAVATTGSTSFDWKRFKGEKIEVQMVKSPFSDILQKYQKDFEDLTGITVGSEQTPEQQHRQKQVIEFTSGTTTFDVTMESWHVQKRLFGKGKWLEDVREFLKDPTMTPPDYDWADFSKAAVTFATQADGRIDTLPIKIDYWMLYWNTELFKAKGVSFPKTWDETVEAAKKLNDPSNNVYGFIARGLKNANTPVWTCMMQGWDVDSVDDKGVMHTDGPEAVAAAQLYQTLLKNYAPAGVNGFNWNECQTSFMQGTAAMWFDGIGFATPLEDKNTSKVVGKVGYGVTPAGPKGQFSGMFGDGMGVSAFTKKKGPAYFYCLWATNKANQALMLQNGAGSPCRNSAYKDKDALANLAVPQAWVDCLVESGKIGRPGLPVIIPVTEFRDVFGVALTNMIGGADPATELKKATADFKPVLAKSETS